MFQVHINLIGLHVGSFFKLLILRLKFSWLNDAWIEVELNESTGCDAGLPKLSSRPQTHLPCLCHQIILIVFSSEHKVSVILVIFQKLGDKAATLLDVPDLYLGLLFLIEAWFAVDLVKQDKDIFELG